jgi:hypothetical protein
LALFPENLEEMLENQDPLLCGEVPVGGVDESLFSSLLLLFLVKPGRVGVIIFGGVGFAGRVLCTGSVRVPLVFGGGGVEAGESGLGAGESRAC